MSFVIIFPLLPLSVTPLPPTEMEVIWTKIQAELNIEDKKLLLRRLIKDINDSEVPDNLSNAILAELEANPTINSFLNEFVQKCMDTTYTPSKDGGFPRGFLDDEDSRFSRIGEVVKTPKPLSTPAAKTLTTPKTVYREAPIASQTPRHVPVRNLIQELKTPEKTVKNASTSPFLTPTGRSVYRNSPFQEPRTPHSPVRIVTPDFQTLTVSPVKITTVTPASVATIRPVFITNLKNIVSASSNVAITSTTTSTTTKTPIVPPILNSVAVSENSLRPLAIQQTVPIVTSIPTITSLPKKQILPVQTVNGGKFAKIAPKPGNYHEPVPMKKKRLQQRIIVPADLLARPKKGRPSLRSSIASQSSHLTSQTQPISPAPLCTHVVNQPSLTQPVVLQQRQATITPTGADKESYLNTTPITPPNANSTEKRSSDGDIIALIAEKGAQKYVEKLDSKKLDEFVKKLHSRQNKT